MTTFAKWAENKDKQLISEREAEPSPEITYTSTDRIGAKQAGQKGTLYVHRLMNGTTVFTQSPTPTATGARVELQPGQTVESKTKELEDEGYTVSPPPDKPQMGLRQPHRVEPSRPSLRPAPQATLQPRQPATTL